jgi:anti-sigma factor RsiW
MNSEFEMNQCQPWEASGSEDEQFERFELLSAYIDGEVTPQERKQVQHWIDTDPDFKQAYLGLIRLQTALPQLPIPPSMPTDQLSKQIFERIEKENRWQRLWLWGSLTAAAIVVAACSSIFVNPLQPASQQAKLATEKPVIAEEPLMIAINEPLFDVLESERPEQDPLPRQQ